MVTGIGTHGGRGATLFFPALRAWQGDPLETPGHCWTLSFSDTKSEKVVLAGDP